MKNYIFNRISFNDNTVQLHFIRHAKSIGNEKRILQGHMDEGLCDEGRSQAMKLVDNIPVHEMLFSSPLKRVLETVKLSGTYTKSIILLDDLKEINVGLLEGVHMDDMTDEHKIMWKRIFIENDYDEHQGETARQFAMRCLKAMDIVIKMMREIRATSAVIYTHSGVIKVLAKLMFDVELRDGEPTNASIISFVLKDGENWMRSD